MGQYTGCFLREGDEQEQHANEPRRCLDFEAAECTPLRFRSPRLGRAYSPRGDHGLHELHNDIYDLPNNFWNSVSEATASGRRGSMQELRAEMMRLRAENGSLQRSAECLAQENQRLAQALHEVDFREAWRDFDVVEQHYKQLEEHRRQRGEDSPAASNGVRESPAPSYGFNSSPAASDEVMESPAASHSVKDSPAASDGVKAVSSPGSPAIEKAKQQIRLSTARDAEEQRTPVKGAPQKGTVDVHDQSQPLCGSQEAPRPWVQFWAEKRLADQRLWAAVETERSKAAETERSKAEEGLHQLQDKPVMFGGVDRAVMGGA